MQGMDKATQARHTAHPPPAFSSLCPAEARPLLTALYTPPPTPPYHSEASSVTPSRYIFLFANGQTAVQGTPSTQDVEGKGGEWKPVSSSCCREAEWDAMGWEEVSRRCGQMGAKVSLIILGVPEGDAEVPAAKRLKAFIQSVGQCNTGSLCI